VTKPQTSTTRLEYLDWLRGLGAAIMLQGHVFDSFLRPDLRSGGPFIMSQFLGGMPPAIFLFLTGVTLGFLMHSSERSGLTPWERVGAAFRRSGYLFFLAFAFRLQMWVFGISMHAPVTDLFKVDVLNCMGFSIALLAPMAWFRTAERVRWCAMLGLAIAFAAPLVSQLELGALPWQLRAYLVPDFRFFGFFPWAAYLAFGMSAGSVIRLAPAEMAERAMQWAAITGGGLILASQYFAGLPWSVYSKSDYWLNSPALVLTKLGVTLIILASGFLWTRYAQAGWSWVRQLGTTSLLVYWVHIELVYGRWLNSWKNGLALTQTIVASGVLIVLMVGLSTLKTRRHRVKAFLAECGWSFQPKPERVPGD